MRRNASPTCRCLSLTVQPTSLPLPYTHKTRQERAPIQDLDIAYIVHRTRRGRAHAYPAGETLRTSSLCCRGSSAPRKELALSRRTRQPQALCLHRSADFDWTPLRLRPCCGVRARCRGECRLRSASVDHPRCSVFARSGWCLRIWLPPCGFGRTCCPARCTRARAPTSVCPGWPRQC